MFKFQNLNKYSCEEGFDAKKNIKTLHIILYGTPECCPYCEESDFIKKAKEQRTVIDLVNGEPTKVMFTRQRYECKNCRLSLSSEKYPYADNVKCTEDFEDYVAQTLVNKGFSYSAMSKMCGVGTTYLSNALNNYVKRFNLNDMKIQACRRMYFHKFEYNKKIGCCVCGQDSADSNDLKLLGLYDSYSEEIVRSFFEKLYGSEKVKIIYFDLSAEIYTALKRNFPYAKLVVSEKSIFDGAKKPAEACSDEALRKKMLAIQKQIFEQYALSDRNFPYMVRQIYESNRPVSVAFEEFVWHIYECKAAAALTYSHKNDKIKIGPLKDLIEEQRKKNVPFNLMVARLMILSKALRTEIKKKTMGRYMSGDPARMFNIFAFEEPSAVCTYYVDVHELTKEIT